MTSGQRDVTKGTRLLRLVVMHWGPARMTVETGASMAGVSPCTFWRWIDGLSTPLAEQLLVIERVFGISPGAWFEH